MSDKTHVVVYQSIAPRIEVKTNTAYTEKVKKNIRAGRPIVVASLFKGTEDQCREFIKRANFKE